MEESPVPEIQRSSCKKRKSMTCHCSGTPLRFRGYGRTARLGLERPFECKRMQERSPHWVLAQKGHAKFCTSSCEEVAPFLHALS